MTWPAVQLRRVARFAYGDSLSNNVREPGNVKVYGSNGPVGTHVKSNTLGPVLVIGRKGSFGKVHYSRNPVFAIDTTFYVDQRFSNADLRWLYYALQVMGLDELSEDVGVPGLSREKAYAQVVPFPPLTVQCAIANYLDCETARIDALIAVKRRMAELLDERWASVRRYLTWSEGSSSPSSLVQLRRIARLQAGSAFPHQYQGDANGTIPYVKVGDLPNVDERDQLRGASNRVIPEVAAALHSPILPRGTIILPKIGAALLTNKRAILSEPSCLDQNVMGVVVQTGNPRFVYHCLACLDMGELSTPGPVPLLNEEAAVSMRIPWPSREEQDKVVAALDRYRGSIAVPRAVLTRQVALLLERRQSLITAAVTGELRVAA